VSVAANAATPSRLDATGLQKSYGSRRVVKEVHLSVDAGEVVGLLGPTARARRRPSTWWSVWCAPTPARSTSTACRFTQADPSARAHGTVYLPQEASIFRKLNVEENIRAVLELQLAATASR